MQKIDFGVLSVVRQSLIRGAVGASCGLTEADLYTAMPRTLERGEAVVLDIEEAWHFSPEDIAEEGFTPTRRAATSSMAGKIVFRLIVLSESSSGSEALDIANQARFLLDGATLPLQEEASRRGGRGHRSLEATFHMVSSVVDLKKRRDLPRKVEQYYEVLIHKKQAPKGTRPQRKRAAVAKPTVLQEGRLEEEAPSPKTPRFPGRSAAKSTQAEE